ncbi:hypothetical protein [Ileibacterium valens]|uniref:hypothetical protein n=1 Tax=Ileibacterium valens TaxID=1862668 RepID=UPI00272D92E1|nr:hypothetical protein [Ileibacterium valens]
MKKRYFTAALCVALLLASGCSSSKKVSTTCSTDILGMKMSVEISAPSENDKVDAMAVKVDIPLSYLETSGVDTSDKGAIEEFVTQTFGGEIDESQAEMNVEVGDKNVLVSLTATPETLGITDESAPTYKEVIDQIKDQDVFACE